MNMTTITINASTVPALVRNCAGDQYETRQAICKKQGKQLMFLVQAQGGYLPCDLMTLCNIAHVWP
jgi:hypothetical protein